MVWMWLIPIKVLMSRNVFSWLVFVWNILPFCTEYLCDSILINVRSPSKPIVSVKTWKDDRFCKAAFLQCWYLKTFMPFPKSLCYQTIWWNIITTILDQFKNWFGISHHSINRHCSWNKIANTAIIFFMYHCYWKVFLYIFNSCHGHKVSARIIH